MDILDAFNFAMATWGADGKIKSGSFQRVVELDCSNARTSDNPNYLQCMAVAHWATGETSEAVDYLDQAKEASSKSHSRTEFSCWQYLQVSAKEFEVDLIEIRAMVEGVGDARAPKFAMQAAKS